MVYSYNPTPISPKIAKRAKRYIGFICRQLLQFAKMPTKEHMAYLRKYPEESCYRIPRPDGRGHNQCGALAWNKLKSLKDLVLDLSPPPPVVMRIPSSLTNHSD